jgi:iron(III) transport system ATP-binding protein
VLKIVDLKKTYDLHRGNVAALKGVSFEVADGDFFTLLGPSGSGKSTAMRCVAGLEYPESGEIFIDDLCVFSSKKSIRVPPDRRPIGMVFQSYAIWPHMTVYQNVAFPLSYGSTGAKPSRDAMRAAVREALRLVQMEAFEDRPATQLSGGQQQRVALARALVRKPKLLLLDEPLSNLDAKLREDMRIELKELTKSLAITSLFVTHDQVEALSLSDTIGVIMDGQLVELGAPFDVYARTVDKRVAAFLGIANTIEGRVVGTGATAYVDTPIGNIVLRTDAGQSAASATVAVRPEAVMCSRERPAVGENIYEGTIQRTIFLGTFVIGDVRINGHTLRVSFNPYGAFSAGEKVFVHIPAERWHLIR